MRSRSWILHLDQQSGIVGHCQAASLPMYSVVSPVVAKPGLLVVAAVGSMAVAKARH